MDPYIVTDINYAINLLSDYANIFGKVIMLLLYTENHAIIHGNII